MKRLVVTVCAALCAASMIGCPDTVQQAPVDVVQSGTSGDDEDAVARADATVPTPRIDAGPTVKDDATSTEPDGGETKIYVPCTDNADCDSGWCVETADGKTCTETCIDSCPKGWFCGEVSNTGQDVTYICLPRFVTLCRPCVEDAECAGTLGASGSKCLKYGAEGSFCGAECSEDLACAEGYTCDEGQCRLSTGLCECSWKAIKDGAKTTCSASNESGTCTGDRSCLDGVLSGCSALTPSTEVCDGVDNDCDAVTDEDVDGGSCTEANEFGVCEGVWVCSDGGLACSAATPEIEICDGKDNDCDGEAEGGGGWDGIDEGFPDSDADGIADCISNDDDADTIPDIDDNCPKDANTDQADQDKDDVGDVCDPDEDGDGDPNATDCAPQDPEIGSKNTEVCNGVDDDCDDLLDEGFPDLEGDSIADCVDEDDDGDGWDDVADNCPVTPNPEQADKDKDGKGDACDADADGDGDPDATDCAPFNLLIHHGADEECNGKDENCNGIVDEGFPDTDGDTVADCIDDDDDNDQTDDLTDNCPKVANPGQFDTDADGAGDACDGDDDGDGDPDVLDCAPLDADVSHKATEVCNGKDDDCDVSIDEADADGCKTFFFDDDSDGHGLAGVTKCLCDAAPPYSATVGGDCNDKNPQVFPGADEVCNLKDDNCDEAVDEGAAIGCQDAYADADKDGFGVGEAACLCPGTGSTSSVAGDCDDTNPAIKPGALETCNGVDDNCNDLADEVGAFGCEKLFFDSDGDGFGLIADSQCLCEATGKYTAQAAGDCNDGDVDVFPGKIESCDAKDNNCNGQVDEGVTTTFYPDDDEDGFGASYSTKDACEPPEGYVAQGGDCNDFNDAISPGTSELCDGIDNDCDGQVDDGLPQVKVYVDLDGDSHGAEGTAGVNSCLWDLNGDGTGEAPPDGFSLAATDCNDSAAAIYPGAPELCDGELNDCDAPVADYQCPTVCAGSWPVLVGVTVGWPMPVQMDADNPYEVVSQGTGKITVLEHDGAIKWQISAGTTYSYPVVADLNSDGYMDVVGIESGKIRVLNSADGAVLESYTIASSGYRQGLATDVDDDGIIDLISAGSNAIGVVHRDGTGGAKSMLTLTPPADTYFAGVVPAAADIDGDGVPEIVAGTGYPTCNGGAAPPCNGKLIVYDGKTGEIKLDPDAAFLVKDPTKSSAGGPWPVFADVDSDGENELFHHFSGSGAQAWNLDGTTATPSIPMSGSPRLAPIDTSGALTANGELRNIGGGAVDLNKDGKFEVVTVGSGGLSISQGGQVMDGYPVKNAGAGLQLGDIDRDGRLDVVYVGIDNASINCYTLGEQTFSEQQLLTLGSHDAQGGGRYRTGAYDPYEPNDRPGFDPLTSTNPVVESRALRVRGFRDKYSSSGGWSYKLRAALGTKGDRDFYWAVGTQINVQMQTLAGGLDADLYLHMYKKVGDSYQYITTYSKTGGGAHGISCHNSSPCPDVDNAGTKTFLIEVRPADPEKDFGPWPYQLRIPWGAS